MASDVDGGVPAETVVHDGDLGPFEGSVCDAVVFGHYRNHGTWSPGLLELLERRLGTGGGTLIDVGANIGLVSIPLAQRTGCRVYAFEPGPANYHLLTRNVGRHDLQSQITTFPYAAYDQPMKVTLNLSADNHGDHRVNPGADQSQTRVQHNLCGETTARVEAVPIADCLAGHPMPSPVVMKIDTQGCEYKVLVGAQPLLDRVETLVVEYWPQGLQAQGTRLQELNQLLAAFPFAKVLGQDAPDDRDLEPSADLLNRLEALLSADDPGFFDVLLTRTPSDSSA